MIDITRRKKTSTFFRSSLYIFIISLATLASWVTEIPYIAIGVYSAAMFVMVLFDKEMTGLIPIVLYVPLIFADNSLLNTTEMSIMLFILIFVLLITSLIYYEKHKIVMTFNRGIFPFLIFGIAALIGGINNRHILTQGWFLALQIFFGAGALYFLLCNILKTNWKLFFVRSLTVGGLIIVIQFWLSLIMSGDFFNNLTAGSFDLGWGNGSAVTMALLLLSPFSLYLAMRARNPIIYTFIYFLNFATIIATQESLGIVIMIVFTVIMASYSLKRGRRPKIIIAELAVLAVAFIGVLIAIADLRPVLSGVISFGFSEIFINWEIAITEFISGNLLIGNGFAFNSLFEGGGENVLWYKSNLLQIANNLGLIGLAGFGIFSLLKYRLLFSHFTIYSKMTVFSMMMAGVYGFVSADFFKAYYFLPLVVLLVIAYNDTLIRTRGEYGIKRYRLRIDNFRFVYGKSNKYKSKIKVANPNFKYYKHKLATKGVFFEDLK